MSDKERVYQHIMSNGLVGHREIANDLGIDWGDVIDACDELESEGKDLGQAWRRDYMSSGDREIYRKNYMSKREI